MADCHQFSTFSQTIAFGFVVTIQNVELGPINVPVCTRARCENCCAMPQVV